MTREFIPLMRDVFVDAAYEGIALDGSSARHDTNFLVAVHGIIYPIFDDYSWDRDERKIYYNGSGGDVALGAMAYAGIENCADNPRRAANIIKKAIEKTCEYNAYCALPVVIKTQYTKN